MNTGRMARFGVLALGLGALAADAGAETAKSRWLDAQPVANWNKAGGAIPRGPKAAAADIRDCERRGAEENPKSAATPETRQVTAAGWLGAAVEKRAGDTVYVFARNGVDGMCRPMDFQIFVFVAGRFAGTIAPRPMDSREDGSGYLDKVDARRFTVNFTRYRKDDALCCPSRTSTVTYEIRAAPGGAGALAVPVGVETKATQ